MVPNMIFCKVIKAFFPGSCEIAYSDICGQTDFLLYEVQTNSLQCFGNVLLNAAKGKTRLIFNFIRQSLTKNPLNREPFFPQHMMSFDVLTSKKHNNMFSTMQKLNKWYGNIQSINTPEVISEMKTRQKVTKKYCTKDETLNLTLIQSSESETHK